MIQCENDDDNQPDKNGEKDDLNFVQ